MTVISVDLACKDYADIGLVLLRNSENVIDAVPIDLGSVGLEGSPKSDDLAEFLTSLATEVAASFILIDGPQAWKSPDNGLEFCRMCEKQLNTPGKTGLPGTTTPGTYLEFTRFSVDVFDRLDWTFPRLETTGAWPTEMSVETFPTAAWRSLGLKPLTAKGKSSAEDVAAAAEHLQNVAPVKIRGDVNHDQLQAAVAGLAGVALERREFSSVEFAGVDPFQVEDTWREGYIVLPRQGAAGPRDGNRTVKT